MSGKTTIAIGGSPPDDETELAALLVSFTTSVCQMLGWSPIRAVSSLMLALALMSLAQKKDESTAEDVVKDIMKVLPDTFEMAEVIRVVAMEPDNENEQVLQ